MIDEDGIAFTATVLVWVVPFCAILYWIAGKSHNAQNRAREIQEPMARTCLSTVIMLISLSAGIALFVGFLVALLTYGPR